jgi:spermidine synthase
MEKWFRNKYSPETVLRTKIKRSLFKQKSQYQTIEIVDTYDFGRMLVLDGIVNVADKDEFVYHEMMTHVPLFSHPNPKTVLVIGGGDGGIVREIGKHSQIKQIDLVEIDSAVISVSKDFLPKSALGFKEPRLTVYNDDGAQFVKKRPDFYDLIIIDAPDPIGAAKSLYSRIFYKNCYKALKKDGILTTHAETPSFKKELKILRSIYNKFKTTFPIVELFTASIPSYSIGIWCFIIGSKAYHPLVNFQENKARRVKIAFQYYNAAIHRAAFALPTFLKKEIQSTKSTNGK